MLWIRFIFIKESLTLDRARKLDSNRLDSEASGVLPIGVQKIYHGGQGHAARTRRERVRPIRFDQGIGAIDRETGLSPAFDSGTCAAPCRAYPDYRIPDYHLPRRVRAGGRSEPSQAGLAQARPRCGRRSARGASRPPGVGSTGPRGHHRAPAKPASRPDTVMGLRGGPPYHRHRHGPARARPDSDRGPDRRQRPHSRRHQCRAAAERAGAARRRHRTHTARRRWRAGRPAAGAVTARPGHRHPGTQRLTLAVRRHAVRHAVRYHRLRGADPGFRIPLAVDPRPRRRPHQ